MNIASFLRENRQSYGIVTRNEFYPVGPKFQKDFPDLKVVIAADQHVDLDQPCKEAPIPLGKLTQPF